jgi:hypothetical protein
MEPVSATFIAACCLFSFLLGALTVLVAVALGAYLVFRTKREPHESLFGKEPEAKAFVFDEFADVGQPKPVVPRHGRIFTAPAAEDPVPGIMDKQTEKFLQVLAEKKAKEQNG